MLYVSLIAESWGADPHTRRYQLFSRQCSKPFELTLYFQPQICQRPICFLIHCKYTNIFNKKQVYFIKKYYFSLFFTLFIYSSKNIITGHGKTGISLPFHTGPWFRGVLVSIPHFFFVATNLFKVHLDMNHQYSVLHIVL